MGRPRKQEIELTETERRELEGLARSRTAPHGLVRRARIVLGSADRRSNTDLARELGLSIPAVGHWRKRFLELGLVGLYGEHRPGRPRTRGDEEVAALLAKVLRERPADGTHWTVRAAGAATGMPKSTVQRYLALFGVRPHRSKGFRLSTDPEFVEKARDVVGLYLNPPDKAVVPCVDEKSQIQALERSQPVIPGGPGEPERASHDHRRHGTTTLFAALDVANGQVTAECRARHRHQEFLAFLERIDAEVPAGLDVHLVVDNYCTHKHAKVRAWLAARPVRSAAPHPRPLHADLRLVAEPGRALVRDHHPARDPARLVREHRGAGAAHRGVRGELQRPLAPVRLDRHRRPDPRQDRPLMQSYLWDSTLGPVDERHRS